LPDDRPVLLMTPDPDITFKRGLLMDTCFVVMPFGKKPRADSSGRQHDYDKIYRVIIQRAIKQAGMHAHRADETVGSRLIHTDMFRDLRDRRVVLVDLSGYNPNVYYELGVRHVMSSCGTVLICTKGTELPFDVKLSRTIFYEYDGQNIDWEEVEKIVPQIQSALEEAKKGIPDSPIHALLESVTSSHGMDNQQLTVMDKAREISLGLVSYQQLIARQWQAADEPVDRLLKEHGYSAFGIRAVGYLCMMVDSSHELKSEVARRLYDLQQYDLSVEVFRMIDETRLTSQQLILFGSAISEAQSSIGSADRGLQLMQQAIQRLRTRLNDSPDSVKLHSALTQALNDKAGLCEWRWRLSKEEYDLSKAISLREEAMRLDADLVAVDPEHPLGYVALNLLKLLLLNRILDGSGERQDVEGYRERAMSLRITPKQHPNDASYLRWYQAIVSADLGDEEGSQQMAMTALREDLKLIDKKNHADIGHRQYARIRRFLEQYAPYWMNPTLIGKISQFLYVRHE
jgi:tetratricopeptide (TPR) repeat protein